MVRQLDQTAVVNVFQHLDVLITLGQILTEEPGND